MTGCFHCGEPVPRGTSFSARRDGVAYPVCCAGCLAAVEWIDSLGLADYYTLRSENAATANDVTADYSAWDRPSFDRRYVRRAGDVAEVCILVDGVRCAACSWLIGRALGEMPGVVDVALNPAARRLRVRWMPAQTSLSVVLMQLARLGYRPHPLEASAIDALAKRENDDALKRLAVAALGMMQAMMYAVTLYAGVLEGMDESVRDFFRWIGFLVTTPVVLYSARPFFAGALRDLRGRRLGMDVPVAFAIGLVYVASLVEAVRGGNDVYFDSAAMFVFFLLAGRYLEMRARHRCADVVDALARLQPAVATVRRADGTLERIGVAELECGDTVIVAAGDAVPADGELTSTRCGVDESMLTGEADAQPRHAGDRMLAGSVVVHGPAEIRVTQLGSDTVLSTLMHLVARAADQRPHVVRDGEIGAARFVACVLALTVATASGWWLVEPSRAFHAALAVLVVACPCAFALAVPVAFTRALAVLARRGVLVVDADALMRLADARRFLFDKTGTLTDARPELADTHVTRGSVADAVRVAAALEVGSRHPIANALRVATHGQRLPTATDVENVAGHGIRGVVDGRAVRLGRPTFALGRGAAYDGAIVLADGDGEIARFHLREHLRDDAAATIATLAEDGCLVGIVSGDAAEKVDDVARRVGRIPSLARQTPARKLAHVETLRAAGESVVMVGDGVNDAAVLAAADVGVAMAGAADLAQAQADVVLANGRLDGLLLARDVARQTRRIMRQNLHWAMGYNLGAIPLAAFGLVPPWLAAIGMSLSSILVVLNSLRIALPVERTPPMPSFRCEVAA